MHQQPEGFVSTPRTPATNTAAAQRALSEKLEADLENRFTYHAPKDDQVERYGHLRAGGRELARLIALHTPTSREQALALTNLEQAIFWANAAIARW